MVLVEIPVHIEPHERATQRAASRPTGERDSGDFRTEGGPHTATEFRQTRIIRRKMIHRPGDSLQEHSRKDCGQIEVVHIDASGVQIAA